MALLCAARLSIEFLSFERWRSTLGPDAAPKNDESEARQLARHVERAASLLPFRTKCLPRAIALSWMLRKERIAHAIVIAVRPRDSHDSVNRLHAWVEAGNAVILGDLPGPWIETLRLGT